MYHSIIINGFNTWDDWHLVPDSRPLINPPELKSEYIEIPGSDDVLDYTELLSGLHFGARKGTWDFIVHNGYGKWNERYAVLLSKIHGQKARVVLEDEPGYFYEGRLTLDEWVSGKDWSTVKIGYTLGTYKYPTHEGSTAQLDWLWNDLFDNIIYYGTFQVVEEKPRNLINPGSETVYATAICTSAMTAVYENGTTYNLVAGENKDKLPLQNGSNLITFRGNGRVIIDYAMGKEI